MWLVMNHDPPLTATLWHFAEGQKSLISLLTGCWFGFAAHNPVVPCGRDVAEAIEQERNWNFAQAFGSPRICLTLRGPPSGPRSRSESWMGEPATAQQLKAISHGYATPPDACSPVHHKPPEHRHSHSQSPACSEHPQTRAVISKASRLPKTSMNSLTISQSHIKPAGNTWLQSQH